MFDLKKFKRNFLILIPFILIGCKAEFVELNISENDLKQSLNGSNVKIPFKASFSQFGNLDENMKNQLNIIIKRISEKIEIEDFELNTNSNTFNVNISGKIPMIHFRESDDPYYIFIKKSDLFQDMLDVQFKSGRRYINLKDSISMINPLAVPAPYQPLRIKVNAPGSKIIAPASEINGNTKLYQIIELSDRVTLNFRDGPFDKTGGGFSIKLK